MRICILLLVIISFLGTNLAASGMPTRRLSWEKLAFVEAPRNVADGIFEDHEIKIVSLMWNAEEAKIRLVAHIPPGYHGREDMQALIHWKDDPDKLPEFFSWVTATPHGAGTEIEFIWKATKIAKRDEPTIYGHKDIVLGKPHYVLVLLQGKRVGAWRSKVIEFTPKL